MLHLTAGPAIVTAKHVTVIMKYVTYKFFAVNQINIKPMLNKY